jgi:hypothetical protein
MRFKPDFERTCRLHEAFWNREPMERPLLLLHADRQGVPPYRERLVDPLTQWTDAQYIIEEKQRLFRSTFFAAEAVPHVLVGVQGGVIAAGLGCRIRLRRETCWFEPVIDDWGAFPMRFDRRRRWWRLTQQLTESLVEAGRDRFLVDIPDFQSDMDTLSDLRGPQRLCLDLYENPEAIEGALRYVFEHAYRPGYEAFQRILTRHTPETTTWLGVLSRQRQDVLQADFLALVSPPMASRFVIPNLVKEARFLERSLFHLDGPGALDKLELLLEIEELDGIQWVPGAGQPSALRWLPLLRRIQGRGKLLYVSSPPEEVEPLARNLDPRGLCIAVEGRLASEGEAEDFIASIDRAARSP